MSYLYGIPKRTGNYHIVKVKVIVGYTKCAWSTLILWRQYTKPMVIKLSARLRIIYARYKLP